VDEASSNFPLLSSREAHYALRRPARLYRRREVLTKPSPVPSQPGVYAWYFRNVPPGVRVRGCHRRNGLPLLYVGIAPRKPSPNGKSPSKRTLAKRIRNHLAGNASSSTLRLTLGCLLAGKLGIKLRRVGIKGRYTFTNPGEIKLDAWLDRNALVTWIEHPRPWELEEELLKTLSLPLNIDSNDHHAYVPTLRSCRKAARAAADAAPLIARQRRAKKGTVTAAVVSEKTNTAAEDRINNKSGL
jgi:hypothetical protein